MLLSNFIVCILDLQGMMENIDKINRPYLIHLFVFPSTASGLYQYNNKAEEFEWLNSYASMRSGDFVLKGA